MSFVAFQVTVELVNVNVVDVMVCQPHRPEVGCRTGERSRVTVKLLVVLIVTVALVKLAFWCSPYPEHSVLALSCSENVMVAVSPNPALPKLTPPLARTTLRAQVQCRQRSCRR